MSTHTAPISLSDFRQNAAAKKAAASSCRVWDRVQELCAPFPVAGKDAIWEDAAEALLQYMNNEWPIEKINKVRADQVAEFAAQIYITGVFSRNHRLTNKAMEIQGTFIEACEEEPAFSNARRNFCHHVSALEQQIVMGAPTL